MGSEMCIRDSYKGNLQFPLFPEPATKEICNFLCSQGTILRQHPASTAGVHRCPKLTPVPNRRFPDLQPIYKVARNCSGKGEALWSKFRLPVGDSVLARGKHFGATLGCQLETPPGICVNILRQHPASTACVSSLRQHPASTLCCSHGPLQKKSSISFVPGAHYKGNLQFPLFPEPTTKEICNFLCSQGPLQTKSSISFVPGVNTCLLYTSPSPRDGLLSRMPSSA